MPSRSAVEKFDTESAGTLEGFNSYSAYFRDSRDVKGPGHYVVRRSFASGDSEMVCLKMDADQSLRKGGGAKRENKEKSQMSEPVLAKSQSRAVRTIRHKCLSICADRLLTLTFRENLTDINEAWKKLEYFHRLMRWRYKDKYQFVVVPEYQKRGAVHFHIAIAGYYHVNTVRKLWGRAAGSSEGNIDITSPKDIGKNSLNPRRIGNYIAKYISKNDSVEINRKRYASSKYIPQPVKQTAWLPSSDSSLIHLFDVFTKMANRQLNKFVEIDGYYPIVFFST